MDMSRLTDVLQINNEVLFEMIKDAIIMGSKKAWLSWSDFSFKAYGAPISKADPTPEQLIKAGMPYLDAIYYCNAEPRDKRPEITWIDSGDPKDTNVSDQIRGLFCWFFSIYTQGRAIAQGSNNFLRTIVPASDQYRTLIEGLTSANIENFPKEWVKKIDLSKLGEESKNRLALGAAGHRYIGMLRYIKDEDYKDNMENAKDYIAALRAWTKDTVWWDLHSAVKSGQIVSVTKSLNKTIEDCLHHCLTDEAKSKFVNSKLLHSNPNAHPGHSTWDAQSVGNYPELKDKIFEV